MTNKTSTSSKTRPIQRRRSSEGSVAKPTGETYSSRISDRCYRAEVRGGRSRSDGDALGDDDAFAAEGPALFFGHAAPDPRVLAGGKRPFEAGLLNRAGSAYGARGLDLRESGTGGSDREEQFRIDVATRGFVSPIHGRWIHALLDPPGHPRRRVCSCEYVLVSIRERARAYIRRSKSGNTFPRTTSLEDAARLRLADDRSLVARARSRKRRHEGTWWVLQ